MGLILQDQSTGHLRPLGFELLEIVALVSADVDQKHFVGTGPCTLDQIILHRIESWIHPAGSSLVVGGHEVVELAGKVRVFGVGTQELEEV